MPTFSLARRAPPTLIFASCLAAASEATAPTGSLCYGAWTLCQARESRSIGGIETSNGTMTLERIDPGLELDLPL